MERLTFEGNFCDIAKCSGVPGGSYCESGMCYLRKIWERLKAFEDLEERKEADKQIFRKALDTFGAEAQTRMVFEEFAELQKELCKNARGKDNRTEIAEEIADVQIMLEQMILLYDCECAVQLFRAQKVLRLAEKLEEGAT